MSNQIINMNNVQAQFAALATDKEKLRSMIAHADQQRKMEETQLEQLKAEQRSLTEAMDEAHSEMGRMKKKRQHFMHDKELWTLKIHEEQWEMKLVTDKMHTMEAEERVAKINFCKEMEVANDERLILMQKRQEKKLVPLLSISTCQEIMSEFLSNNSSNNNNNSSIAGEDLSSTEDCNEPKIVHGSDTCNAVNTVIEWCNQLIIAEETWRNMKSLEQQLNEKYLSSRLKALEYQHPLNGKLMDETNLDELEEDWMNMEQDEIDQSSLTVNQRNEGQHMGLFYNEMPTTDSSPN